VRFSVSAFKSILVFQYLHLSPPKPSPAKQSDYPFYQSFHSIMSFINKQTQWLMSFAVIFFILCGKNIAAQAQNDSTVSPFAVLPKPQEVVQSNHYLAWGISAAVGDVNLGDDRSDLMYSMLYTRRLSSTTELECGLHYIAVQKLHTLDGDPTFFSDSATFAALAWQADCAWTFQPFQGFLERFRLGIGPSFRFLTATYMRRRVPSGPIPAILHQNPNGTLDTLAFAPIVFRQVDYFQGLSFGAVIKIEYIVPLSPNVDFIARAQLHSYMPPIIREGSSSFFGSSGVNLGSAGVYLRVGW
jgi:hypothetical protein